MRTKTVLSWICLILAFIVLATAAYALFTSQTISAPIDAESGASVKKISIADEYSLRKYAYDMYDNPNMSVSNPYIDDGGGSLNESDNKGQRDDLVLAADIVLSGDLIINRDINLDLNGFNLDLNGYDIYIEHGYFGTLTIRNGNPEEPYRGKFINSGYDAAEPENSKESALYYLTPNAIINDAAQKENVTAHTVFSEGAVVTGYEEFVTERIFELAKIEGVYLGRLDRGDKNYLTDTLYPGHIDLMRRYFNADITFTWESDTPAVVDDGGNVTPVQGTAADIKSQTVVEMTLTVVIGGTEYAKSYEITVPYKSNDRLDYGIKNIEDFLKPYMYETDEVYIYNDIELPADDLYLYINYSYTAVTVRPEPSVSDPENLYGTVLKKNSKSRIVELTVTADNNYGNTETKTFTVHVISDSNLSVANEVVSGLNENRGYYLITTKDDEIVLPAEEYFADYGVIYSPDMFSFVGNGTEDAPYFYIEDGVIKVANLPESGYITYLELNLTFMSGEPANVRKQVPIYYIDSAGGEGGEGEDRYSSIYEYLNNLVNERTGGRSYNGFSLPGSYNLTEYGVSFEAEGYSDGEFDALTLTSSAENLFEIDPTKLPLTDTAIRIYYEFVPGTVYGRFSSFVIPGVINNDDKGIPDVNLYNAVLALYDKDADGVLTVAEAATDTVPQFSLAPPQASLITTLKGLEFLKNTLVFNLDNVDFASVHPVHGNNKQYLSELRQITSLSMRNTGITNADLNMFSVFTSLISLDIGNNNLSGGVSNLVLSGTVTELRMGGCSLTEAHLGVLSNFITLKTVYIHNNDIRLFGELLNMQGLEEVYVYNQTTPVINSYYGPEGSYNYSYFMVLTNRGIDVYNGYENNEPKLFAIADNIKILLQALESIVISSGANGTFILPARLYIGGGTGDYYTLTWNTNFTGTTITSVGSDNYEINYPYGTSGQKYELYATITGEYKNNAQISTQSVSKVFIIQVP